MPLAITASLVTQKVGAGRKLFVRVFTADGQFRGQVVSPFQKPAFQGITVTTIDTDGDGASNIAEYHAGTQPNNYDSAFRIVSFQRETNNTRITWTTVLGKSYRVQTNAPINGRLSTNFYDVSPLIAAPTDGNESTTNFVHVGAFTNAPAGYYCVRVGP